ncbi:hypothetical protein D3C87_1929310 [compost metagenome]
MLADYPTKLPGQCLDFFAADPGQVDRKFFAAQPRIFEVSHHRPDVQGNDPYSMVLNIVALVVVLVIENYLTPRAIAKGKDCCWMTSRC